MVLEYDPRVGISSSLPDPKGQLWYLPTVAGRSCALVNAMQCMGLHMFFNPGKPYHHYHSSPHPHLI